jgi:hypothetical protein
MAADAIAYNGEIPAALDFLECLVVWRSPPPNYAGRVSRERKSYQITYSHA